MSNFKKLLSICLTIILVLSVFSVNTTILAQRNTRHKYVVVTRNHNHTKERIGKENIYKEHIYKDTSDVIVADMSEYEAEQLEATDEVVAVVEDIPLYAHSEESEETLEEQQELWNVQMINAEELTQNEQTVKVGVMDSGINFGDNISVAGNVDFVEEETPFLFPDYSGHGTAVASVISSKNFGVKPNSSMYSIKVIDSSNEALLSNVLSGIYWAIENDIKILNMSFGTATYSPALEQAINDAHNAGIIIIASAGNGTEKMYPAGFENVIAVGSLDHKGEVVSENSQHYTNNLLFAPGERVATEGDFGFVQESSGTSFACPHVTAIAAQILEKDQTKTNDFVKSLLFASANTSSGVKVLDAQYALQNYDEFESTYQPTATTPPTLSNTTDLTTFTDVEFEALWSSSRHQETVTSASNASSFTQKELNIVKVFSAIPDKDDITFKKLQENPVTVKINSVNYSFENYFSDGTNLYYSDGDTYLETAITAVYDDDIGNNTDLFKNSILHGRYNYVANLRYLFNVAKYLWTSDDYKGETVDGTLQMYDRRTIIRNALKAAHNKDANDLYKDTNHYTEKSFSFNTSAETVNVTEKPLKAYYDSALISSEEHNLRNTLDEMIYLAVDCKFVGNSTNMKLVASDYTSNNSLGITSTNSERFIFQRESALKVLGIAIHLLGDIYAHKTVIQNNMVLESGNQPGTLDEDTGYYIYKGATGYDFNHNGFWDSEYGIVSLMWCPSDYMMLMTTHQLKNPWQYAERSTSYEKKKKAIGKYEDNIMFLPERYNFSKKSVNKFILNRWKFFRRCF